MAFLKWRWLHDNVVERIDGPQHHWQSWDLRKVKGLVEKTEILKQKVYQWLYSNGVEVEKVVACAHLA